LRLKDLNLQSLHGRSGILFHLGALSQEMRIRFSVILPVLGLILFADVSYRSMSANRHLQDAPHKYYSWSSLRLDTDPQNKHTQPVNPCESKENCPDWEPAHLYIAPSWLDKLLVFSALPAFLAGAGLVIGSSKLGVDEVLTFMVSMPILLFVWYHFVGWLLDLWLFRRQRTKNTTLKIT
jgi:hypothetical protein